MATYEKNPDRIKVNSGADFWIKFGSPSPAWQDTGDSISGKISKARDSIDITLRNGNGRKKKGKRDCTVTITLAQTGKNELELADVIEGQVLSLFLNNGESEGKVQEFYFPKAECIDKTELEMEGNKHQVITLEFAVLPAASGNAVCIPDTDLPAIAVAEGEDEVEGKNPYYVILET